MDNTRMNASVIIVKFCGVDYATHGVRGSQAASPRIKSVASRRDYCVCAFYRFTLMPVAATRHRT